MMLKFYFHNQFGHIVQLNGSLFLLLFNYYDDAIYELENFLKKYKNNEREDYAYYLLALSHYEKISDEKDLGPLLESKNF